jgi:ketosteroid isomerase-like protein
MHEEASMRISSIAAIVLCLSVPAATPSTGADIKADVAAAYAAWDAAFNKGDPKAVAANYLPNAKLLPPTNTALSGPSEIETFFAGLISGGVTDHKLDVIDTGGEGKVVFGAANWSAKAKAADGTVNVARGFATHVFDRQPDGSLKLRLHTFN